MLSLSLLIVWSVGHAMGSDNTSCDQLIDNSTVPLGSISPVIEKHESALLQLLGFGGFSLLLAIIYNVIRRRVYKDADNLDTTFDAGGKVSMSLTAVTVASQLMWPADLLHSASVAVLDGIAGPFWYSVGAVVNMTLFPVLSLQFKIRAPGAKTFLQLLHARFGVKAHILFTFFALLTNLVVLIALLVAGIAIIQSMTKDASPEFSILIIATLFGSYAFVGGLGTTFYVSYFNAVLIFVILVVFIVNVFYIEKTGDMKVLGNFESLYKQLSCLEAPPGNEERSYLTITSKDAIIWGVQGVFATSALAFCDQASWQSRIAAKPVQGVLGFFAATYMWFAIPTTIGSSTGLAYLALSSSNSTYALPFGNVLAGLTVPYIAETTLGYAGAVMVLTMLTMALMSTGSGEVMAVSSIIVYDIYQIHINPFRRGHRQHRCLLCGQTKPPSKEAAKLQHKQVPYCACPPAAECQGCERDMKTNEASEKVVRFKVYNCEHHGQYRHYQESLIRFKSWCILWVTVALIPLGLAINITGIDLFWVLMVGFIITTPGFPPAILCILWVKTSTKGVIAGGLSGLVAGLVALLSTASTYEGGLNNFLVNTSKNYSVLAGSATSFFVSFIITIAVSLFSHNIKDENDVRKEWQKLRDIDNPLNPWGELFTEEFPELEGSRPTEKQLSFMFRKAKWAAYIGGAFSLLLFVVVMPSVMASMHVLTLSQFRSYLMTLQVWCFIMAAVVIIVAPVEEGVTIARKMR